MKIIIGVVFIVICSLGLLYFRQYNGTVIPYPIIWRIIFLFLGFMGFLLISKSLYVKKKKVDKDANIELQNFISKAELFELNFDNCEFKSGSYSDLIDDQKMDKIQLLGSSILNIADLNKTENVIQSYLIYRDTIQGELRKFTSHSFPFDQTSLKFYVLNYNISLYVDRFNKEKYQFILKS